MRERQEFLSSKFKSIDIRLGQLRTRHAEKSAELARIVARYESACRPFALNDGPDPAPIRGEREKAEAQLRGLAFAIEEAQQERAALQPEWEAVNKVVARQEWEEKKEVARKAHADLLERRALLLKEVDELDTRIQQAFFEWDCFLSQERMEAQETAERAWKAEASKRAPGSRRVVIIGGEA